MLYFVIATQLLAILVYLITINLKLAPFCENEGMCYTGSLVSMWSQIIASHDLLDDYLMGTVTLNTLKN